MAIISTITNGPESAAWTLFLAHGAGAPMDTAFMNVIAEAIGLAGIRCVRFEFPYMHARRETGKRAGPNRMPVLIETFEAVLEQSAVPGKVAVGGKSMGGRAASMLAAESGRVDAVVCLGYPFHPPGKPEKLRTAHLETLRTPTLIVQGTRDPFGGPEEVAGYALSNAIRLLWLEDGDHSFKPRVKSGFTLDAHIASAARGTTTFLESLA